MVAVSYFFNCGVCHWATSAATQSFLGTAASLECRPLYCESHLSLNAAGLLDEGDTMQTLLSRAGSEPGLFLVDYWEPFRSYAARIDAQDGEERKGRRKQHAGRLLLYKQ